MFSFLTIQKLPERSVSSMPMGKANRAVVFLGSVLALAAVGCGMPMAPVSAAALGPLLTSVTPSATGMPNSVATQGKLAFVSVQGAGKIFVYNIVSGTPVAVSSYTTPCADPSGMALSTIGSVNVLAVVCFDSGSLVTLSVSANGTLSALGSVGGLPSPFPGLVMDGTDVYVPLYGVSLVSNGAVAKVSLASPASPTLTATTTVAGSASGGISNPSYLALNGGYVYVVAGSETNPRATTSTLQVIQESTMALVGSPVTVDHSPQEIVVSQGYAFVTYYDSAELQSFDVSNAATLVPLQTLAVTVSGGACSALPIVVFEQFVYVGCYGQASVLKYNVSNPASMTLADTLTGVAFPQGMVYSTAFRYLLAVGSNTGGSFYEIDGGRF